MNNKLIIIGGVVGILIVIIVALLIRIGSYPAINSNMNANIDRHFIEQMIPHHEGAIQMAQLALEKGARPEIKALAQEIIEAQQREIADMKTWHEDWFGAEVAVTNHHMMGNEMMGGSDLHMNSMSGDLEILKNAKDFDLEFIRQMVPHHEVAVMMAQMLQGSTNRSEMKTLADNIITSQTREIEMMRDWEKAWK